VTIRRRLTLWYAAVLTISLLLISAATYNEFREHEEHHHHHGQGLEHDEEHDESALEAAGESVFNVGLPAIILGIAGGWWLTRRALQPLAELTAAAKGIDERTLDRPLPRSGNGDELDELSAVLNAMQTRLRDSFSSIREFTLHASHELKTPLTIMHGELETALRESSFLPAERERLLSQLDELQRLSKIVDGLTLLTHADSGRVKMKKEPVRLDELVRDLNDDTVILAEPSNIRVELAPCEPMTILGDTHRLRQLLLNLADNAVKYNERNGFIKMTLTHEGDFARFSISNSGPGIAAEALPKVFDRFFRGDSAHSSEVEGCGLGLSIAHWITAAHGGTIQVESAESKVTTVTLKIPLAPAA
jgi:signal transduction histidine kinase